MMKKITLLLTFLCVISMGFSQEFFSEDFSGNLDNWTLEDSDTDSNNWYILDGVATSASWNDVVLTPDNWMITPAIDITTAGSIATVEWDVMALNQNWADEVYSVYVSTSSDIADLSSSTTLFSETVGVSTGYMSRSLDLSSFIGQTIYVGFRHHNVTDQHRINIDNVIVSAPVTKDMKMLSLMNNVLVSGALDTVISGVVKNTGTDNVTAFDIVWNDGVASETFSVSGVNLAEGDEYSFIHTTEVSILQGESKNVTVTVNLTDDEDSNNNAKTISIASLKFETSKVVLGEEATGTWCGWCPRGAVFMEQLKNDHPDTWIGVAVHNGDPMAFNEYDDAFSAYISGYPSGSVNRTNTNVDPSSFPDYYASEILKTAPADLDLNVVNNDGVIDIKVEAQFAADYANNDYRLGVIVIENNVTGTGSGYNQVNYYSGGGSGELSGGGVEWHTAADPVPAADMVYQDVGRALLGGFDGDEASLPDDISECTKYTYDFSYTLPDGAVLENFEFAAVLIDNNASEVVNAKKAHIGDTQITNDNDPNACKVDAIVNLNIVKEFNVFPNPTSDVLNIKIETKNTNSLHIELVDVLGRSVLSTKILNTITSINTADLNSGIYIVNVISEGVSIASSSVIVK